MNSLKNETIKKIFGANIQGGMGLALSLLERASMVNWEALWPQFQKAMIGLGVAAIATIQSEAIRKGLSELAERIASFQPTVSPMPGEPLTRAEAMPVPYIPAPAFPESIKRVALDSLLDQAKSLLKEIPAIKEGMVPPDCNSLDKHLRDLIRMYGMLMSRYQISEHMTPLWEAEYDRYIGRVDEEIRETYSHMQRAGCGKTEAMRDVDRWYSI